VTVTPFVSGGSFVLLRRLIALFSLLSLTNLVFVQSGSACGLVPAADGASSSLSGHDGHDMGGVASHEMSGGAADHEMFRTMPDDATTDSSTCPVMNACVVTLELVEEPLVAVSTRHSHVAGGTDDRPMSPTAEPEIPPPRA
jgi:hypothetical protein